MVVAASASSKSLFAGTAIDMWRRTIVANMFEALLIAPTLVETAAERMEKFMAEEIRHRCIKNKVDRRVEQ